MTTWLAPEPTVTRIELDESSWVDVVRGFVPHADVVHEDLAAGVPWKQERVYRYERWVDEPRLGAFQAGGDRHPALQDVETWLSARYCVRYDGVALARYRNERDSVGWHRDRELKWLEDTVIGVLTTGAQRPFLIRPLTRHKAAPDDTRGVIDLRPASGDLLVMGGRCQAAWLHAVPKTPNRCRSRISAQWRWTSRRGRPDTNPGFYEARHFNR